MGWGRVVVNKFVQASLDGWQDYLNSPEAAHAAIARLNPALNSEWMMFSWHALRDGNFVTGPDASGLELGKMEPALWTTMSQQLKDPQIISQSFDPADEYTLQFVQKR